MSTVDWDCQVFTYVERVNSGDTICVEGDSESLESLLSTLRRLQLLQDSDVMLYSLFVGQVDSDALLVEARAFMGDGQDRVAQLFIFDQATVDCMAHFVPVIVGFPEGVAKVLFADTRNRLDKELNKLVRNINSQRSVPGGSLSFVTPEDQYHTHSGDTLDVRDTMQFLRDYENQSSSMSVPSIVLLPRNPSDLCDDDSDDEPPDDLGGSSRLGAAAAVMLTLFLLAAAAVAFRTFWPGSKSSSSGVLSDHARFHSEHSGGGGTETSAKHTHTSEVHAHTADTSSDEYVDSSGASDAESMSSDVTNATDATFASSYFSPTDSEATNASIVLNL